MQPHKQKHTDKDLLISTLIHAISELETRLLRDPSKEEVLDYLFSSERDDPEAIALEEKLDPVLATLLADWAAMDDFDQDDAQYFSQPIR